MNKGADRSDVAFLSIATIIFLLIFWNKYFVLICKLYLQFRYLIAVFITAAIIIIFFKVKKMIFLRNQKEALEKSIVATATDEDALFAGTSISGRKIYLHHAYRRMHAQVVGTTNAGKTESVIVPWAIDDIKRGRGVLIMDGKSDRDLLNKIYAYAKKYGREDDVRILSICESRISNSFNPFAGGSALEITERVFSTLSFESEYFRSIQYESLLHTLLIFESLKITPTPVRLLEFLRSPAQVNYLAGLTNKKMLLDWALGFTGLTREEREQRTSGLLSQIQVFAVGETSEIFNPEKSDIDLNMALKESHIIFCQLPVLKIPTLGKMAGKFILQALQGATASRHLGGKKDNNEFFSVYLDDFTEYLTKEFVTTLNKSRSAKVMITFAHQALGDLAALGDDVKNSIQTNANLKVFMRTNEPTSADHFSAVIGTGASTKVTERQVSGVLGKSKTGDGSVRDVEEFKIHPNVFKQELGVGEGVMVIPHAKGSLPIRLKFQMSPDLSIPLIPMIEKREALGLPPVPVTFGSGIINPRTVQNLPEDSAAAKVLGYIDQNKSKPIEGRAS